MPSSRYRRSRYAVPCYASPGVLIVNDDLAILSMLNRFLPSVGLKVWVACSVRQGLQIYRQHEDAISMALLDLNMPEEGGVELAMSLREVRDRMPICFMTNDAERLTLESLVNLGADWVFSKPLDLVEVSTVLNRIARAGW